MRNPCVEFVIFSFRIFLKPGAPSLHDFITPIPLPLTVVFRRYYKVTNPNK